MCLVALDVSRDRDDSASAMAWLRRRSSAALLFPLPRAKTFQRNRRSSAADRRRLDSEPPPFLTFTSETARDHRPAPIVRDVCRFVPRPITVPMSVLHLEHGECVWVVARDPNDERRAERCTRKT